MTPKLVKKQFKRGKCLTFVKVGQTFLSLGKVTFELNRITRNNTSELHCIITISLISMLIKD
jgi:hypothetical protein